MATRSTPSTDLVLAKRALHELPRSVQRILCSSGSVWITQDGDTQDIVLAAGESFLPDARKRTLVFALAPSALSLQQASGLGVAVAPARWRNPVARVLAMG